MTQEDRSAALLDVVLEYALALPTSFDVEAALYGLALAAGRIVESTACGVMVVDGDGALRAVAGSDMSVDRLESLQLELGEGPCLTAYRIAEPIWSDDLGGDERWPRFGPAAARFGMVGVLSAPMAIDGYCIGAYNVFQDAPAQFPPETVVAARILASLATGYVVAARTVEQREALAAQLQEALDGRVVIEQAKGRLSVELSVDPTKAFEVMRAYARSHQTRLKEVAQRVMTGKLRAAELRTSV
jgi:hypothetical protein